MEQIKVLLADGKEVSREGLTRLLEEQEYIEVVSKCSNGKQAVKEVKETRPDVVLIDSNISDCDSNKTTREIKESSPEVQVAMLTDSENEQDLFSAIESGATGYLLKDIKVDDLVKSIDLIGKGEVVVSPPLSERFVGKFASMRQKETENQSGLTQQELEVVKLLAKGATNKEIAKTLFIAENTVKAHLKNILWKLGLRNRQQVVAYVVQQGLVAEVMDIKDKPS